MGKHVKVVLNRSAVATILKSDAMQQEMLNHAKVVALAANANAQSKDAEYTCDVIAGQSRARARVKTANDSAVRDNAYHNTLEKSKYAAGGFM